jgi:signal transduction histidine kinase
VLAALETVLEYEPIPESTRTLLEEARLGILRLTSMLADRTAAFSGPPNFVAGPLGALLTCMVGSVVASIDPDSDRLDVSVRGSEAEVRLDTVVVEGALAVLVANAWRHRRAHGVRVTVEAGVEGEFLVVSVSDDGRGIDVAALRRAGEVGFTTRSSGVGLGLFRLRRAVSARGGAVVLEALDPGLRATVVLPLSSSG